MGTIIGKTSDQDARVALEWWLRQRVAVQTYKYIAEDVERLVTGLEELLLARYSSEQV